MGVCDFDNHILPSRKHFRCSNHRVTPHPHESARLGLDNDDDHYSHTFKFGSHSLRRYSDNALKAMREALSEVDLEKVWRSHRTIPYNQHKPAPICNQPGCVLAT